MQFFRKLKAHLVPDAHNDKIAVAGFSVPYEVPRNYLLVFAFGVSGVKGVLDTVIARFYLDDKRVFAVEIKELRETKNVEINDEFAKSLGEKDLDALKAAISERIKGDYEAASRMKLKRALLDNLDKNYNFDVPQGLVDAEYKSIVNQYEQAKKYNQLDESEKAKSEEELLAEYKDIAIRRVKLGLLLSEIGKDAKINITPDDINKAIMNEAKKYPGQEKAVFDYYLKNKEAIESLKAPVFEEKIVDHILSKAKVSEKVVSIEELYNFDEGKKPAKKATAKKETKAEEKKETTKKSAKKSA